MPTTYTSLLGLSLPATGELAGTWGTEVNNGITSLLDAAIAGTTTLSTDANVTLTTTTGAANQARQQILLCTGARTAQRTITAPAQSKTYVVINATTGGFAVQLVGAGPTAGVTILSGERAVVAWNGSDFVKVSSNLVTGTATRIPFFDASGLLSSAADFVRDASGNVLVNPSQNAPTQIAAANANTGTAGVGQLVAANNINNAILATYSTGHSTRPAQSWLFTDQPYPLIFGTANTERMRIDSSGNVGIGATPTLGTLEVRTGGGSPTFVLANSSTRYGFAQWNDSIGGLRLGTDGAFPVVFSTQALERMRIDSSGNVGIGATPSAWNSVWSAVDIGPYASIANERTAASQLALGWNFYGTGVSSYAYRRTGDVARIFEIDTSGFRWSTAPSGTAGAAITFTERMRIDSSGNVGIGVTAPGARLNVVGAGSATAPTNISDVATAAVRVDTTRGSTAFGGITYSDAGGGGAAVLLGRGTSFDTNISFYTNPSTTAVTGAMTERMRITSTGNIVAGASAALATTATDGFLYVPTCAGTPTGTPTAITGMAPIVVNTTNNKLYFYSGGAWRDAGP